MDAWNGEKPSQESPNPKGLAGILFVVSLTRVSGGTVDGNLDLSPDLVKL
jgi:hypothetical protein